MKYAYCLKFSKRLETDLDQLLKGVEIPIVIMAEDYPDFINNPKRVIDHGFRLLEEKIIQLENFNE